MQQKINRDKDLDGLKELRVRHLIGERKHSVGFHQAVQKRRKIQPDATLRQSKIICFVSNDHNAALGNIHKAIRRKLVAFRNAVMLHVDSHPDLVVPRAIRTLEDLFDPHKLYACLEASVSGIAEFIIPLLAAGHVTNLVWLKPPWAKQIRCGTEEFHVGFYCSQRASKGDQQEDGLRVTTKLPYFRDDGSYAPEHCLVEKQPVSLVVTESGDCLVPERFRADFILDICLDYFSVNNPFKVELEKTYGTRISELATYLFLEAPFYRLVESIRVEGGSVDQHQCLLEELRSSTIMKDVEAITDIDEEKLYALQVNAEQEFKAMLLRYLRVFRCRDTDSFYFKALKQRLGGCFLKREQTTLWSRLVELEECISMMNPQREQQSVREVYELGLELDLPHHVSKEVEIAQLLDRFEVLLTTLPRPAIITLAKSSNEAFDYTPKEQLSSIYNAVISLLNRVYENQVIIELDIDIVHENAH